MTAVQAEILLGVVVQLLLAVYVYGKLTEKVSTHSRDITELKAADGAIWGKLEIHSRDLSEHGERLAEVETKLNMRKVH